MEIKIPDGAVFPALLEIVPDKKKVLYGALSEILSSTGARHEEMTTTQSGFVVKGVIRIYSLEQAEKFLLKFFELAHTNIQCVKFDSNQCFRRVPFLVYIVEADGHVAIV